MHTRRVAPDDRQLQLIRGTGSVCGRRLLRLATTLVRRFSDRRQSRKSLCEAFSVVQIPHGFVIRPVFSVKVDPFQER